MSASEPPPVSSVQEHQRRILEKIALGAPLEGVLDDVCLLVESLVPRSRCSVARYDPSSRTLSFTAAPSFPTSTLTRLGSFSPGPHLGSCASAVHEGRPVFVEDTRHDPRWSQQRELAESLGIRSCWSVPILSSGDEVLGTFGISRDLVGGPTAVQRSLLETAAHLAGIALEREQTVRALREQRVLLESILASAEDPIFAKDLRGRYVVVNEAESEGVAPSPAHMLGRTDEELYPPEVAARMAETDARVLETGEGLLVEASFENPLCGRRTFVIRKNPLRDADGRPRGVVGVARDVTQVRRTEAAMHQAQKLESLGVLAGGIAHDFNNLLTGVLGNAELALRDAAPGTRLRESLQEIRRAAGVAAELTGQMLAYAGRTEVTREEVSLPALVREVAQLVACSISKKASLVFDVPAELPPVHGDPPRLRQVVMNLLTNASEALEDRAGELRVRMRCVARDGIPADALARELVGESFVTLSVTDTGRGMDEATLARIFDPFFTTKVAGRGLGLAAVQGIVASHGGAISVHSLEERGTTFTVYLPASRGHVAAPPGAPRPLPSRSATVLLADDEPAVSSLARRILEEEGHRVLVAEDGAEALELLRRHAHEIELLVLDWTMPRLSGEETLRRARAEGFDQPAILSSGYAEPDLPEGFRQPGVTFLKKPWDVSGLLRSVAGALH